MYFMSISCDPGQPDSSRARVWYAVRQGMRWARITRIDDRGSSRHFSHSNMRSRFNPVLCSHHQGRGTRNGSIACTMGREKRSNDRLSCIAVTSSSPIRVRRIDRA